MKNGKPSFLVRSVRAFAIASVVTALVAVGVAFAASWGLDLTWDTDGKVITDIGTGTTDTGRSIVMQADNKVVLAGVSNNDFAVVRYNTNGSLDTAFDTDGKVTTDIGTSSTDTGRGAAVQTDGKIVVAGVSNNDFAVVRYNADGSLDTAFDTDGKVTTDIGTGTTDAGNAMALQTDGKIVVAGVSNNDFAVVRYNADGSLDTAFDTDGKVTTDIGTGTADVGNAVALQADGKIVVLGTSDSDIAVVRYNTDGSLDTAFGTGGKQTVNICATDYGTGVAIQTDGKIVIGGWGGSTGVVTCNSTSSPDLTIGRLNTDGSLDTAGFAAPNGVASQTFGGNDNANAIIIQQDGKILLVGNNSADYGLQRWNTNGTLDTTFNGNGRLTVNVSGTDIGYAAVEQSDGRFLVAGVSSNDFSAVRFGQTTYDAVGLAKTAVDVNGAPLQVGDLIRYTITITNPNSLSLTNVVVTDTLPSGVAFDSATPGGYSGPNPLVWNVGSLSGLSTWTGVITAHVDGTANPIGGNNAAVNSDQLSPQSVGPILPSGSDGAVTDVSIAGLTAANDSPTTVGQVTNLTATITAGSNVTYTWDFGDSSSNGSGANVAHTYAATGTYTAIVTATNSAGSQFTTTLVTVTPVAPFIVADVDDNTYTEGSPPIIIDNNITIQNGNDFSDGYLKFDLTNGTSNDQLVLTNSPSPSATGAISVIGVDVYLGNGTGRDRIGSVDATENGQNGQPLLVNFASPLVNGSFEDNTLTGWDQYLAEFNATSTDYSRNLNGQPIDYYYNGGTVTGTGTITLGTNNGMTFNITTTTVYTSHGARSLQLHSQGHVTTGGGTHGNNNDGNLSLHGPYLGSSSAFHAFAGDSITLDWMAIGGSDSYEVFGYLVQGTPATTYTLLFSQRGDSMPTWNTENIAIPTEDDYRFLFVGGTYDQTGGYAVGADLYVDNIRLLSATAVDDAVVKAIGQLVTYQNTSATPQNHTRNLTVSAQTADGRTDSDTANIFFLTGAAITKTAVDVNGAPLEIGDLIRYTIDITNENVSTMTNVVVTDTLPAGVTFDSATPGGYSGPNPLVWNVGALASGVNWTGVITAHVDGTVNPIGGNSAMVNSDLDVPHSVGPIYPSGGGTVELPSTADLSISKSFVRSLNVVTYTIVARNLGPGIADGAIVSDSIAARIVNVSWTCAASGGAACTASGSGNTINETLSSFPVDGVVTYTVVGNLGLLDDEINTATITPPAGIIDPNTSNNTSTVGYPYRILLPMIFNQ